MRKLFLICCCSFLCAANCVFAVTQNAADAEKLVRSLENKNAPPKIWDWGGKDALFANDYDWKEQDRVLGVINKCLERATEVWPVLVDHLEDKQYCMTFKDPDGEDAANVSLGQVCKIMLESCLVAPYGPRTPHARSPFARLIHPDFIPRKDEDFRLWWQQQKRQGATLRDLQIRACEWALASVRQLDLGAGVSEKQRQDSIAQIQQQLNELRVMKKPVLPESILSEAYREPYMEDEANEVRDQFARERSRKDK